MKIKIHRELCLISIPAGQWHNPRALDGVDAEMVICFSLADRETEFEEWLSRGHYTAYKSSRP
jgi:hypothetical protein